MDQLRDVHTGSSQYGPLQPEFAYTLRWGYTAILGANNAGKSALLQLIFRVLHDDDEFGASRLALVLTDRDHVEPTTQTGSRTLAQWNNELVSNLRDQPLGYAAGPVGPGRWELARLLMHGDLLEQVSAMNELLVRFELPEFRLRDRQEVRFEDIGVYSQGTGLRALFSIVAALTNRDVRVILIDEPELSLEPRLQKVLRDILIAVSSDKAIVVTTHSHLFLHRGEVEANQVVTRDASTTSVLTLTEPRQLQEVTFDLLGSSTEDLFFPSNYMIVEGASDQVILEKMLNLLGSPPPTVKVLSARGIDAVRDAVESVVRALVPLIVNDSPYSTRVIALIDQPANPAAGNVQRLGRDLGDRLYVLDVGSIEQYMPEAVYERAGRSKRDDLRRLDEVRGNYEQLRSLKREVSDALAAVLMVDDLEDIPIVAGAARQAIELAQTR